MENILLGIHHVTAMTDSAERNYDFFTQVLGYRLVKKTVNQDDIHTYHTFFADDMAAPGTDMTFFDFPGNPKGEKGTNSVSRVGLRVPNDEALKYYADRFDQYGVKRGEITDFYGTKVLDFEESDGQSYRLWSDQNNKGIEPGTPWKNGPVDPQYAIYGLGPVEIKVTYFDEFKQVLEQVYGMVTTFVKGEDLAVLSMDKGGHGGQVVLRRDLTSPQAQQGYGQVHHIAFRVKDHDALQAWLDRYEAFSMGSSGLVDRYYFEALYTRVGHILIELATDGPGFMQDEPYETLGEKLSLPPFLEPKRADIEARVRPFDTVWKDKK